MLSILRDIKDSKDICDIWDIRNWREVGRIQIKGSKFLNNIFQFWATSGDRLKKKLTLWDQTIIYLRTRKIWEKNMKLQKNFNPIFSHTDLKIDQNDDLSDVA